MIRVNANLFRAVSMAQSTEETRYCLRGVYIHPHAVTGAVLVATNGHILLCAHDPEGVCDVPAIIGLDKVRLGACRSKPKRTHVLTVTDGVAEIHSHFGSGREPEHGTLIETQRGVVVDGTFPDYARCLPRGPFCATGAGMDGRYLGTFADAGCAVSDAKTATVFRVLAGAAGDDGPLLVRYTRQDNLFGVLMPVRHDGRDTLPAWFDARPVAAESEVTVLAV